MGLLEALTSTVGTQSEDLHHFSGTDAGRCPRLLLQVRAACTWNSRCRRPAYVACPWVGLSLWGPDAHVPFGASHHRNRRPQFHRHHHRPRTKATHRHHQQQGRRQTREGCSPPPSCVPEAWRCQRSRRLFPRVSESRISPSSADVETKNTSTPPIGSVCPFSVPAMTLPDAILRCYQW